MFSRQDFSLLINAGRFEDALHVLQNDQSKLWIDELDSNGFSPLHQAVMTNALEVVVELLSFGANINKLAN